MLLYLVAFGMIFRARPPTLFVCAILLGFTSHLMADTSVSYTHTTGPQSYEDHNIGVFIGSGPEFTLGGSYDNYSSNVSSGTFKTYGLSLGRTVGEETWQIFGSWTPEVNAYKAKSIGFKVGEQSGPTNAELGYTRIMQTDGSVPFDINQNDILAGVTYKIVKTTLSGDIIKSIYDKGIAGQSLREGKVVHTSGISNPIQPYPNYSAFGKVNQQLLSWLKIWVSLAHVQYEAGGASSADAYSTGVGVFWQALRATVEFNQYITSDQSSSKFVSTGIGLSF